MADPQESRRIELAVRLRASVPPDADTQALLQALADFSPAERQILAGFTRVLLKRRNLTYRDLYLALNPGQPYPADLIQASQQSDTTKARHIQLQALVVVLVWLVAIIVPIIQQRLSAEGQLVTDAEVGTLSFALAITVLMKQARK